MYRSRRTWAGAWLLQLACVACSSGVAPRNAESTAGTHGGGTSGVGGAVSPGQPDDGAAPGGVANGAGGAGAQPDSGGADVGAAGQAGEGNEGGAAGTPSGAAGAPGGSAGAPGGSGGAPESGLEPGMSPVARHGQLHVSGSELLDEHDKVAMLRGQGFGWDNWWPQYYNADVVSWLRNDWCVDLVRPAMGIDPDGAYLANPAESKARIRAVVDAAIQEGIYVIIDWHSHELHQAEAIEFFTEMAQTYGDKPNVLYEVFNEPEMQSWSEVKAYAEAVIAAIRQHDPDNVVIVGSPEWDQRVDQAADDPITTDSNVVYSLHFYAATHGQYLRDRAADAMSRGLPIFVSESGGSEAAGTGPNDFTEWQAWFDFLDEHQVSWVNYAVADKEGETISVLQPGAPGSGAWDEGHLTESGKHIRELFRTHCAQ